MKNKSLKKFIKENYLSISDKDIAERFRVSERVVGENRRNMGLKKDMVTTLILREKRRSEKRTVPREPNFGKFWG